MYLNIILKIIVKKNKIERKNRKRREKKKGI